jgi:hypothetical protein
MVLKNSVHQDLMRGKGGCFEGILWRGRAGLHPGLQVLLAPPDDDPPLLRTLPEQNLPHEDMTRHLSLPDRIGITEKNTGFARLVLP